MQIDWRLEGYEPAVGYPWYVRLMHWWFAITVRIYLRRWEREFLTNTGNARYVMEWDDCLYEEIKLHMNA
jgi:hypothetical protein